MADINKIETNSFVKWAVKGGMAFGKVVSLKDEKTAAVETPSGPIAEIALSDLYPSNEEEYDSSLTNLITGLTNKKNTKKSAKAEIKEETEMSQATQTNADTVKAEYEKAMKDTEMKCASEVEAAAKKVAECEAAVEAAKKDMTQCKADADAAKAEAEAAKKACAESQAEAAKWKAQCEAAEAKIAAAAKAAVAKARFDELKASDAVEAIDADEKTALAALAEMDEKTFSAIAKVAKTSFEKLSKAGQTGLPKLTDQSQTGMPKLTDQSQTGNTKLTQADAADVKDALDNAKKEVEADLVTAGASVNNTNSELLTAFASHSMTAHSRRKAVNDDKKNK